MRAAKALESSSLHAIETVEKANRNDTGAKKLEANNEAAALAATTAKTAEEIARQAEAGTEAEKEKTNRPAHATNAKALKHRRKAQAAEAKAANAKAAMQQTELKQVNVAGTGKDSTKTSDASVKAVQEPALDLHSSRLPCCIPGLFALMFSMLALTGHENVCRPRKPVLLLHEHLLNTS
eukprot:gnl/TRDRNA2_/TRDRNA2_134517_c0_seq5.p2 gnl/TRDRNA2_/TRDRNA2_134517_c0~~gnl/TRDRNA2_/TRDRNA2_134517_c0_seq5.p2  ORF type:complete len:201 (+),score=50.30 gnl/TRDRNA2_/TRDRNA2_134517_c0_seq5:65-604(+)